VSINGFDISVPS